MRVLVVDDDITRGRGVAMLIRTSGAIVEHVETGEKALALVKLYYYDVVILELMLPDIEGFEVLSGMRRAQIVTPALLLSGISNLEAKLRGVDLGADDYITKPYDKEELVARVQAVARRSKSFSNPVLQVGTVTLNLDNREVFVDGQILHLSGKEYAILELLMLRKGVVLTKDEFLTHLYGGMDGPEMKIIDVFICKLRKKLAAAGAANLIRTCWGSGYMLRVPKNDELKSTVTEEHYVGDLLPSAA